MFNKLMYEKNVEKILTTKKNFSLLFNQYCYYRNNGKGHKEVSKEFNLNWRTIQRMEKCYNLLDKIHAVKPERAIKESIFTTLNEVKLFDFLISDNNFFLKYNEVIDKVPISRYFYNRVKNYIIDEIQ